MAQPACGVLTSCPAEDVHAAMVRHLGACLDRLAPPLVVFDASGQMVYANGRGADELRRLGNPIVATIRTLSPPRLRRALVALAQPHGKTKHFSLPIGNLIVSAYRSHDSATGAELIDLLFYTTSDRCQDALGPMTMLGALSPREVEVARRIVAGKSNRVIASELGVGQETIKTYVSRVYSKLEVHDRGGLVRKAFSMIMGDGGPG